MIKEMSFLQFLHTSTKRDYFGRMNPEKPYCMEIAKKYDEKYWDGDRKFGFGGFHYDGRYKVVAQAMIDHYKLKPGDKVLDIGAGKGFLLYEFQKLGMNVTGVDISQYAIDNAKVPIIRASCTDLPFSESEFELVVSINTLHNMGYSELKSAIQQINHVAKDKAYICVESYRNDEELMNLQMWALTCKSFYSTDDWKSILEDNDYTGDVEFIVFD